VKIADIPVFILCGGLGTRLKEMTEFRPKPMVPIGPEPILLHIMRHYASFGFSRFVLCMGYKSEIVRDYFLNFYAMHSDVTVDLKTNSVDVHSVDHSCDWKVTLAYTGEMTMTGGRIARAAERYLGNAKHYAVTYGDGLTNADLGAEFDFHLSRGKIGTVLGSTRRRVSASFAWMVTS
jgi:glucose-1-phosphate cytidylyltransferase